MSTINRGLRFRLRGTTALLVLCALVGTSACSLTDTRAASSTAAPVTGGPGQGTAAASAAPTEGVTDGFVWTTPPVSITRLASDTEVLAEKGVDYTEEYSTPKASYGDSFPLIYALRPDGVALAAKGQEGRDAREAWLKLGEYNGKTFTSFGDTDRLTPAKPGHGVAEVAVSGDEVIWVESDESDLQYANWWVFAKQGNEPTRLLAQSAGISDDLPYIWWHYDLSVDNGMAYWLPVLPTKDRSAPSYPWTAGPLAAPLGNAETEPSILTEGVVSLSASSGRVFGVRDGALNPAVGSGRSLLVTVPKGGKEDILGYYVSDGESGIGPTAAAGSLLAFAVGFGEKVEGSIWVMNYADSTATEIAVSGKGRDPVIRICGSNVLWTDSHQRDGSYKGPADPIHVYDSSTGILRAIAVPHNYGSLSCNRSYVSWAAFDDKGASTPARDHVARWHPAAR